MKFLGLRITAHDSNITYTNGKSVRYCSTERLYGIKHHGFDNDWQWLDILKKWDIDINDIDAICIVSDDSIKKYDFGVPTFSIDHHYAHALSLWPLGEIPDYNFVYDGYGSNNKSCSLFKGKNLIESYNCHDHGSIGLSMAQVGKDLNLTCDEYGEDLAGKVMGLAAFGLIDEDFYYKISKFDISNIKQAWNYELWDRKWDSFDINWLQTVHEYTGDLISKKIDEIPDKIVGYSGGVAQNCVFNGKISKKVVIPPHANDCGLSLGAVEYLRMHYNQEKFDNTGFPFWQDDEIPEKPSDDTILKTCEAIADGCIVAWYQGAGEIGPRALGHRSILMNPRLPHAKDTLNNRVKHREPFRPFGASVLKEDINKYFDYNRDVPYMNVSVPVKDSDLKSITHIDQSCRIHTVEGDDCFSRLLHKYKELTGDSELLNTSLNVGGKPIASKIWEAKELFSKKDIDKLVIGNAIIEK